MEADQYPKGPATGAAGDGGGMSDEGLKRFHSFKIKTGHLLREATIELDGQQLKGVRSIVLGGSADEVMALTIIFHSDDIDVEATGGVALVEKPEPGE